MYGRCEIGHVAEGGFVFEAGGARWHVKYGPRGSLGSSAVALECRLWLVPASWSMSP